MPKLLLLALALWLSACTNPRLSADLAIGAGGVSVSPALSGEVRGTTISIEPN
jgi:hypothetical protein